MRLCRRMSCPNCCPAKWSSESRCFRTSATCGPRRLPGSTSGSIAAVMREPFLTLLDSTTQWVFNKTQLYGGGEDGGQYLQLVISASYSLARAFASGNHRALPGRIAGSSSCDPRGHAGEGNRRQGNVRDVFSRAGLGPVASHAEKSAGGIISRGRLDSHGLAVDNGRRSPQRIPWLRKRSSPMQARRENVCSPICVRKAWPGCGPAKS